MAYVIQIDHMDVYYVNPNFCEIMNKKVYETIDDAMDDMCEDGAENGWVRIKVFHVPVPSMDLKGACVDLVRTYVGRLYPFYESARDPMSDEEWDAVTWQDAADHFDITSYRIYQISDSARAELGDEMLVEVLQGGEPQDDPDEMEELMEVETVHDKWFVKPDPKPHLNSSRMSRDAEEMRQMRKYGFIYAPLLKKCIKKANVRHARYQAKKLIDYEIDSYLR